MKNSVDPDQMASSEAIWSGSTLFSKAMAILVQQEKGLNTVCSNIIAHLEQHIYVFVQQTCFRGGKNHSCEIYLTICRNV